MARTLAKVLDVPFAMSDATAFTQVRLSGMVVLLFTNANVLYRRDVRDFAYWSFMC